MEGARDPERRGEALQAWIPLAANFLRSMDSNHLVMLGGEGIFGPASPHETHLNPPLLHGRMPWLLHQGGDAGWGDWSTVLPPMHLSAQFAVCEGADFQRNSILSELDVSAAAVAPDAWLSCSDECKLAWTRQWLAAHMRDALRIQRPLLINAVLSHGPPSRRAALLELVISYMKDAAEQGLPVAGVIMPLHAGISANDCESSFAGYSSQVSPSCYTSSMWQLKEPEDHSALRRLRQSSISSIGPANLQQVFKDADTPPSLPADDVHVLNPACICSPAEHRETESTRVSSLLLMPLPGKNERYVEPPLCAGVHVLHGSTRITCRADFHIQEGWKRGHYPCAAYSADQPGLIPGTLELSLNWRSCCAERLFALCFFLIQALHMLAVAPRGVAMI
uniref:Uncharacterized protein n=1 Tax=Dunaliella tertiolecta TaxID=3047 RepID=A0A7S3R3W1_DUNTE